MIRSIIVPLLMLVLLLRSTYSISSSSRRRPHKSGNPSALRIRPPPMMGDPISPDCYNFTVGDWRLQEFYSPNYPGEYLNNSDCVLYLEAPSGFRIQLDFRDHFTLEKSDGCKYDFLEVRDGPFAYSPLIDRFCGAIFPPLVESTNRFLWLRFKTDDLLQYDGFRAIYSYHKDHTQNDGTSLSKVASTVCRIPLTLGPGRLDGVMTSAEVPFGDVLDPNYPRHLPVDCTWEIIAAQGYAINLHTIKMRRGNRAPCDRSFVSVYQGTTLEKDRRARLCGHDAPEVTSLTSHNRRVFVRLYSDTLHIKPDFEMVYTLVTTGDACAKRFLSCGEFCISPELRCNGKANCPDARDERGCNQRPVQVGGSDLVPSGRGDQNERGRGHSPGNVDTTDTGKARDEASAGDDGGGADKDGEKDGESKIPLHMIVLGAVGGVLLTCLVLALCIMCRSRRRGRAASRKDKENTARAKQASKQSGRDKEMVAVPLSSSHPMYSMDGRSGGPQFQGQPQGRYLTFGHAPTAAKDNVNRHSNSQQGFPDGSDLPDIMTESGQFRRYMAMDVSPENLEDGGSPYLYSTPQGMVIGMTRLPPSPTTTIPQSPSMEGGGGGYPVKYQKGMMEDPSMVYPYNSSLPRPSPFLSVSKPYQSDPKYHKPMQSLKVMDNERTKDSLAF